MVRKIIIKRKYKLTGFGRQFNENRRKYMARYTTAICEGQIRETNIDIDSRNKWQGADGND